VLYGRSRAKRSILPHFQGIGTGAGKPYPLWKKFQAMYPTLKARLPAIPFRSRDRTSAANGPLYPKAETMTPVSSPAAIFLRRTGLTTCPKFWNSPPGRLFFFWGFVVRTAGPLMTRSELHQAYWGCHVAAYQIGAPRHPPGHMASRRARRCCMLPLFG